MNRIRTRAKLLKGNFGAQCMTVQLTHLWPPSADTTLCTICKFTTEPKCSVTAFSPL